MNQLQVYTVPHPEPSSLLPPHTIPLGCSSICTSPKHPVSCIEPVLVTLMAPHSSTLAWKIPWMEEPGGLQSMGSLRVGHN